jgi:hypothetical protein
VKKSTTMPALTFSGLFHKSESSSDLWSTTTVIHRKEKRKENKEEESSRFKPPLLIHFQNAPDRKEVLQGIIFSSRNSFLHTFNIIVVGLKQTFQILKRLVWQIDCMSLKKRIISPEIWHKLTSNTRQLKEPVMGIFLLWNLFFWGSCYEIPVWPKNNSLFILM